MCFTIDPNVTKNSPSVKRRTRAYKLVRIKGDALRSPLMGGRRDWRKPGVKIARGSSTEQSYLKNGATASVGIYVYTNLASARHGHRNLAVVEVLVDPRDFLYQGTGEDRHTCTYKKVTVPEDARMWRYGMNGRYRRYR